MCVCTSLFSFVRLSLCTFASLAFGIPTASSTRSSHESNMDLHASDACTKASSGTKNGRPRLCRDKPKDPRQASQSRGAVSMDVSASSPAAYRAVFDINIMATTARQGCLPSGNPLHPRSTVCATLENEDRPCSREHPFS